MPRKSAGIKALRQSKRHRARNDVRRRAVEIALRQYRASVKSGSSDAARLLLPLVKAIDKAAQRRVLPKNTAARLKSRVMRLKAAAAKASP